MKEFKAIVRHVVDGDTIKVVNYLDHDEDEIRLKGIDAPEYIQEHGPQSRYYLAHLILNREVTIKWEEFDRYGRIIGDVYLGDVNEVYSEGEYDWINWKLVRQGYAWHYLKYDISESLAMAQSAALLNKKGLWAKENSVPPWDFRNKRKKVKPSKWVSFSKWIRSFWRKK